MFYSATLLTTSGPLARVWLSANQSKMSKVQILQTNLEDSVHAIITPEGDAPLALRLSGQLLVGVVRIYGRKARYLLDDCNEALMKIKMAFRSTTNHDIPVNLQVIHNRESLMLPDRITPLDNLDVLPSLNMDLLSSQLSATPMGRRGRASNREINLQEDFNNSQFLNDDFEDEDGLAPLNMDDFELDLDFGEGIIEGPTKLMDRSIEMGRDAPVPRSIEDDMFTELDAGPSKDRAMRDQSLGLDLDFGENVHIHDAEGDVQMGDDDFDFNLGDQSAVPAELAALGISNARISESPLSDIDEAFAREVEMELSRNMTDMYEPGDDISTTVVARQRQKKRKLLQPDEQTMLSSAQIKEQQMKRDNILRAQSFIPHDPYVLGLMDLQKSGAFVTNILLEGRSDGWAPELKGLLSLGAIRPNDLKRKRDSGIADMGTDDEQAGKSPRLEIAEDESLAVGGFLGSHSVAADGTVIELPGDDDIIFHGDDDTRHEEREGPAFDETTAPIAHPADGGPVSIGTKHAVHILRELFGAETATNADKRKKASVVFQELLPEETTTKADATKMFFECLVLATKDAIKVEQPEGTVGAPIRVRGKRGLWGEWAEREAGGEIAHQDEQQPLDGPQPAVASAATVAVEA